MLEYVELRPHSKSAFLAERTWRDSVLNTWLCKCKAPKSAFKSHIDVVVTNPQRNTILDILLGFSGFRIIDVALIKQIGDSIFSSLFFLGSVHTNDGKNVSHLRTFRSKYGQTYVRGSKYSPKRFCDNCGRFIYLLTRDAYLCGLRREESLLQTSFGNLLIRTDLFESKFANTTLPNIQLRRLEVRSSSSDGLPVDIGEVVKILKNDTI
jgi:hypothetical protein